MLTKKLTAIASLSLLGAGLSFAQTGSGGKDGSIEKCTREMGTLAVAEPQSHVIAGLTRYQLGSPSIMLRMIAQESGCFAVVERGVAMQNLQQERALASGGMLQQGSNLGGGQMQAADFVLTPSVQFTGDTGGVGATVGNFLGRFGGVAAAIGGIAGGVKFKEAETTILVADVRSGIQVASAEGKASKMDFSLGGWGWGGYGWAAAGGYSKTPEGKLIAASLLDNFNRIVQQIRDKPTLIRATAASSQANAAGSIQATNMAPAPAPTPVVVQPAAAPQAAPSPGFLNGLLGGRAAPARSGRSIPDELTGRFRCEILGQRQGKLQLVVGRDGHVIGSGLIIGVGISAAMGDVDAQGALSVAVSPQGYGAGVGGGMLTGLVDSSGKAAGKWNGTGPDNVSYAGDFTCTRD